MSTPLSSIPRFFTLPSGMAQSETIRQALVDMFDQRAPWPLIGLNIVLASILLLIWWTPNTGQWVWYGGISLISLANMLRHARYHKDKQAPPVDSVYWYRSFTLGTIVIGIAWGMGGIFFYVPELPLHSSIILLLICGIAAGVAASQSSIWPSVVGFVLGAILPPAIYLLLLGGTINAIVSALLLFYLGYILVVGRMNHRTLLDSVRHQLEKQQLLEEMASSERHFRAMVENIPDLFTVVSADGRVIFENPSGSKLLGYPAYSLINTNAFAIVHPDDVAMAKRVIHQVLTGTQGSAAAELRIRDTHGNWRLFDCVGRRLNELDPPAVVINARDITERQAMEDELRLARDKAEQANRIKSQFLATVSHEIRTPMHAILGMAEMLQKTALDNRQTDYVETFHSAGTHLLNLINDILDYSRLEAGGLQLANQTFNIYQLLDEIFALLRPHAKAKGLGLHLSVAPGLQANRSGDPQRLQQILVNLIGNAIKFTPQGEINVRLEAHDTQRIYFAISDTGIGIPQEQQSKLFSPFTQLDVRTTREQGGTGLGLSICRHLVNAMGGKIEVDSSPGRGSCFDFTLDLPPRTVKHPIMVHEVDTSESTSLASASILIADDALMNQRVMTAFLQDTPCRLLIANNGIEAVELYREHQPAMVFMDMQMPQLDGGEATRQIRAFEASITQPHCPIVALSASAMDEDREAALDAGCDEFFAKPLSQHQLFGVLRKYLK